MTALTICSSACSDPALASRDIAAVTERAADAVWRVEADGCGWHSRGSAFAIDARHLVTNRHVVANDSSPVVRSRDGLVRRGRVIGSAASPDLAVIEVTDKLGLELPFASTASLGGREPLVVLGYPAPKHAFNVSAGRIVNFQGPDVRPREAALTNVPIAVGNSGGPGLRADASVAGVVTLMRLRSKSKERVAIMFTADSIRPTVELFIRKPKDVLSTCGLGPDYVPPVPKSYEISVAPRTAPPVEKLPRVEPSSKPRLPTSAPLPTRATMPPTDEPAPPDAEPTEADCPGGGVETVVDDVSATEKPEEPGTWLVGVRGTVTNEATADVRVKQIYVHVDGDPPANVSAVPQTNVLSPGGSSSWEPPEFEVHSPEQPTTATAFASWSWNDPDLASCPKG
jgi:trypsin-like peptidase